MFLKHLDGEIELLIEHVYSVELREVYRLNASKLAQHLTRVIY